MKKRLFLLFCGVMCLFLVLCSCSCDTENTDGDDHSDHSHTQSSTNNSTSDSIGSYPSPDNDGNGDITSPETKCELNEAGHYWSDVTINKNTASTSTVAVSGVCQLCGDSLYKVCTSVVDYEQLKHALSLEAFASFTAVNGKEYTDYDKNGAMSWRKKDNVYTADFYINSETKNSQAYAQSFQAYRFNNFVYDDTSRVYKYKYDDSSYAEFGFADGDLIYYSYTAKNGDTEQKMETLYLNHGRITVDTPEFVSNKYSEAVSLEKLKSSLLGATMGEKIYNELKELNFDGAFEAFLLENDQLSVCFSLNSSRVDPISQESYSTVSILITDSSVVSVTLGTTTYSAK